MSHDQRSSREWERHDTVLSAIGNTRLIPLRHMVPRGSARVFLKLEYENPTGSMKDRMAHASEIIDQIVRTGLPFKEIPVHIRYTEYSLAKGQSSRRALSIALHYLLGRVLK